MRYGYWLPVFGGWLRNVPDEKMSATWEYVKRLAQRSEKIGFEVTLIAELNLNDIKGVDADSLDAWSTAAALAAVTERIELMVAVRPTFHLPALLAKQAAKKMPHKTKHMPALMKTLRPTGVAVVIEAKHLCMMMRGVEKQNSLMKTSCLLGSFKDDARTRGEFLSLLA